MTKTLTLSEIDLSDPDLFALGDPHAIFKTLRSEAPIFWQERSWGPGFWNVTKYEDLIRVSRDPETFVSSRGIVIDNDGERTKREQNLPPEQQFAGQMMIMTDPPRHTLLRQLVNKGFTPRAVSTFEPHIREVVTRIVDEVAGRGECDFVMDISRKLPLEVICELMGVPEGDWEAMFNLTNRIIGSDDPEYRPTGRDRDEETRMSMELFNYFMGLCNERRAEPRDDLLSRLVVAEIDGQRLMDTELFLFFILLIVAGNETTRNATSGGVLALAQHPGERAKLQADPSLIPTAVEEIVRWTSPVMHFYRTATKDVEVRDESIRSGDQVALWYPSANRDEEIFGETADQFDVSRDPNEHLGFGIGEHFCLGANLARLELKVMFEELLTRLPDIEVSGPIERLRSNFIGGIKRMPVRFSPTKAVASQG